MTVEIDPTTGLPKLPEGYYWRIENDRAEIMYWSDWSEWEENTGNGVAENYRDRYGYEVETRSEPVTAMIGKWPAKQREVSYERHYFRYRMPRRDFFGDIQDYKFSVTKDGKTSRKHLKQIDRSNVVAFTSAVFAEYTRLNDLEQLYGNYPPKSIDNLG